MKAMIKIVLVVAALSNFALAQVNVNGANINATLGYQVNGAAPNNYVLCGNGTRGVYQVTCGVTTGLTSFQGRTTSAAVLTAADVNGVGAITNSTSGNAATATTASNSNAVGGVALSGLCQTGGAGCPSLSPSRTCNTHGCYVIAADGTITAWGNSAGTVGGDSAERLTITFPVSFSTTSNLSLTTSPVGEPSGDGNPHPQDCHISSGPSTTGATAVIAISTQVSGSGYANLVAGEVCAWHATGN